MKESIKISNTIKRKIDELGRMIIPIEIRELLNIKENDYLEICRSGKNIILRKSEVGSTENNNKNIRINIDNNIEISIKINENNHSIQKNVETRKKYNIYDIRPIDAIGRIQIPKWLRDELHIYEKDTMKICVKDNMLILIKVKK